MRVLIVDDSKLMRMILERGLRAAGLGEMEIRHAADGAEALVLLEDSERKGTEFNLILSDVHMPVMDGNALLAEARRRGLARGVPVVMITAQADANTVDEPGLGRLLKPFTIEQMQASLVPLLHTGISG